MGVCSKSLVLHYEFTTVHFKGKVNFPIGKLVSP